MGLFANIKLIASITKAVKEVKAVAEENSEIGDKIKEIIEDIVNILNKVKEIVPVVDKAIETIVEIIKKWFKK